MSVMNDFIRAGAGHQAAPPKQEGLTEHEESRVVFYMEKAGLPYGEALEAVRGHQAPPAVNANAGSGTGRAAPRTHSMNDAIRKAWRGF